MKTRITSIESAAQAMDSAKAAFPAKFMLENNHWAPSTESESRCYLGPFSIADVCIADADQLQRVLTNIEALNQIRQAEDGSGWLLHFDDGKPEPADTAATADPAAAAVPSGKAKAPK